jgi:ketosteroid isomerase-like protein
MIYRWLVRRQAKAGWRRLSEQRFDETPLADDMHFVFLGDHPLAADIRGADAVREWLRDQLLRRLPDLRFVVDETLVEGGPWATRVATRYHTEQNGRLVYRGVYFGRIVWGKVVEEIILPDTKALVAALERIDELPADST